MTEKRDFYKRAGIDDRAKFYGALYASGELLHPDYFHALERFHIRWARTMWVYDNVQAGTTLLDLGCGAGLLSLLKRKNVTLIGVDLSPACARVARRNGYDEACVAELCDLPFADNFFDYVVSLDVMGHIEFEQKDAVISDIRRVLKVEGTTLHGIETMNTARRKDYGSMTEDELKHFVAIDGHVGMESEADTQMRFARFFAYVQAKPRFSICQSAEELVKQADEYGVALCDQDLLEYLRNFSHNERRAFNMAMGYLFQQVSDHGVQMPASEYLFLKASNSRLGAFYNEHRERTTLLKPQAAAKEARDLNRATSTIFGSGWYPAEDFPPIGRWMGRRARLSFVAPPQARLSLVVVTHIPDVPARPLNVALSLNGNAPLRLAIADNEPRQIDLQLISPDSVEDARYELEITADRTWQPLPHAPFNADDREISVAVYDMRLVFLKE